MLGDDGWQLLSQEIAHDFPALTIAQLGNIILDGIKGRIEIPYQSGALNFTKIYQWVEARATKVNTNAHLAIPQSDRAYRYEVNPEFAEAERKRQEKFEQDQIEFYTRKYANETA